MLTIVAIIVGLVASTAVHDLTRQKYVNTMIAKDQCEEKLRTSELYREMRKEAVKTEVR